MIMNNDFNIGTTHGSFDNELFSYSDLGYEFEKKDNTKPIRKTISNALLMIGTSTATLIGAIDTDPVVTQASIELNLSSVVEAEDLNWINEFYSEVSSVNSAETLYPLISEFSELIANKEFYKIDKALKTIKFEKLNTLIIVAIARSNFSVKNNLNEWKGFIEQSEIYFNRTGQNSKELLKGLV